jgi:putative GTP pyrophosphokinase
MDMRVALATMQTSRKKGSHDMAGQKKVEATIKDGFDAENAATQYQKQYKTWENLRDEAVFIIEHGLQKRNIKYHAIHKRIKTLKSSLERAQRQERNDPFSLTDMVGIRIVCLFLSDLEKVGTAITEIFDILSQDDKIEGQEVALFGYMSVHFILRLKGSYSGPRYDSVKEIGFELQVRTIAMDAWAATSHYLDYKSEQDVPKALRKDFYALSGLFYVADQHFEMFFKSRLDSKKAIAEELSQTLSPANAELNLDSLQEYLRRRFPDRIQANSTVLSSFLKELKDAGYSTIQDLEAVVKRGLKAAFRYEEEHPPYATKRQEVCGGRYS